MKRLLCIVSCMDAGGAETFLMKVYRLLDKKKYQMDFCVSTNKKGFYDDEIKKSGGKIYGIPLKSKYPIKSFRAIKKIVKDNKYDAVLRTSQQSLAAIDLLAAKMGGAHKLIYRSSNANLTGGFISKFINNFFKFLPRIVSNVWIAPSTEAAEFVFGKRNVKNNKVIILPNGLDYNKFRYNETIRQKIRKELKIDDDITLYGHIGRFNVQKNHSFLIDIFNEIYKNNNKSKLLLIGEGEEKNLIKEKVNRLNLNNVVIMLEPQKDIAPYLMAMDLMIFPSFFEGMPNVIIEAQATGLRCILSDSITKEANITGLVKYLSLESTIDEWVREIILYSNYKREDTYQLLKEKGYLVNDNLKKYIEILF